MVFVIIGIPVSQQHLIHGNTELMDEFCLEEYQSVILNNMNNLFPCIFSIRSGSQLKLVIAMRGGPIHAHRSMYIDACTQYVTCIFH